MESINTHNTPPVLYDALAHQFGETISRSGGFETRWVSIGCGTTTLTFFAGHDGAGKVSVTMPEQPSFEERGPA